MSQSPKSLKANTGIAHDGVKLHGRGFVVLPKEAKALGLGSTPRLERFVRPYRNGMDLKMTRLARMVIDVSDLSLDQLRLQFPNVYQHLLRVRGEREEVIAKARRKGREPSKDLFVYLENWWRFGKPRPELRPALEGLDRYIGTIDTARHRVFQFISSDVICDDKVVIVADSEASILAVLSSTHHVTWANRAGGWLGVGNDPVYVKTRTFDPFPFPDPSGGLRQKLRDAGEELDTLRKKVLAEHPDLTLTGLYNVLENLKAGKDLSAKDEDVKTRGLVLILKELHETIDRLTAEAYGWPHELTDEQILERLVALNAARAKEEAAGHVRWLRPDYQAPRFAKAAAAKTGELDLRKEVIAIDKGLAAWPLDRDEHPLVVEAMLAAAGRPLGIAEISRGFKNGGRRIERRVHQVVNTLALYGRATPTTGERFVVNRAA